jgi:Sulfotransferase domain
MTDPRDRSDAAKLHEALQNTDRWLRKAIRAIEAPAAADAKGGSRALIEEARAVSRQNRALLRTDRGRGTRSAGEPPALFHVTHWKAGSSWVTRIFKRCAPDRVVQPKPGVAHFLADTIQPGMIYPRCYVTRGQFEQVDLPERWARFVVVRDLRDTLVSAYFSVKVSHNPNPHIDERRPRLAEMGVEEGLIFMLDQPEVMLSAAIQRSWVGTDERLIRYEDMLENDVGVVQAIFADSGYPLPRQGLRRAVRSSRFDRITGRPLGEEDPAAHARKGIAGDWRNHFTEPLKDAFKERYGDLLLATGYESGLDW